MLSVSQWHAKFKANGAHLQVQDLLFVDEALFN